jgi:hypothetical protein
MSDVTRRHGDVHDVYCTGGMGRPRPRSSGDVQAVLDVFPPVNPPRARDWSDVEERLGLRLPDDYKALADVYGPGDFLDLRLHVPDCPNPDFDLFRLVERVGRQAAGYRERVRPGVAAPFFPEPGGLVPFGEVAVDRFLLWVPVGDDPNAWPVVFPAGDWSAWFRPGRTFSGCLADYLSGRLGTTSGMAPPGTRRCSSPRTRSEQSND